MNMLNRVQVLMLMVLLLIFTSVAVGTPFSADDDSGLRKPLDLPAGGAGVDDEEEDAPEAINFYGSEFEGDVFVFIVPAYGFCGETEIFDMIRQEVSQTLNQLSAAVDFAIVAYNSTTYIWRPDCCHASPAHKASAQAWMGTLAPIENHCLLDAALAGLGLAQQSAGAYKQVIICGAREPYCNGSGGGNYADVCLESITAANFENLPVHTIYFTSSFYSGEEAFYINLSAMNGGTFRQVDY